MAGASAPPPGAGGRNDGRGSGLMAETGSTSPSAVGKPDFTGWDNEDIQQWQQCSGLGAQRSRRIPESGRMADNEKGQGRAQSAEARPA